MLTDDLYRVQKEDVPKAVETFKDAFKDDPIWGVVFPHNQKREQALSAFFTCPVLYGLKYGKVYAVTPEMEGVASWAPGKYAEMTALRMILCGALPYGAKMGGEVSKCLSVIGKQIEREKKAAMKDKKYVYLSIIGVTQSSQSKGYGSKLLNAIKEECTRDEVYLYLETETQENVRFYEKHGFRVIKKIILGKINLPLWLMELPPNDVENL